MISEHSQDQSEDVLGMAPQEDDVAEEDDVILNTQEAVRQAVEFKRELEHLENVRAKLELSIAQQATAVANLDKSQAEAAGAIAQHHAAALRLAGAKEHLSQFQKANGKLRGWNILGSSKAPV